MTARPAVAADALAALDLHLRRRGAAKETVRAYATSARQFLDFLERTDRPLAAAGTADALAFAVELRRRGATPATVQARTAGVAALLGALARAASREAA